MNTAPGTPPVPLGAAAMAALVPHLLPVDPHDWRQVRDAWLLERESPHTRRSYARTCDRFVDFLAALGVSDPLTATRVHVAAYAEALRTVPRVHRGRRVTGYPAATRAQRLSVVSSFYDYAEQVGAVDANPAAAIRRPRVDKDHSPTVGLTGEQARALLTAAEGWRHGPPGRAAALTWLALSLGARVCELTTATLGDLGHQRGHHTLTLTRKGGARQVLPVPAPAWDALGRHLVARGVARDDPTGWRLARRFDRTAPLLATATGRRWNEGEVFRLVRSLATAAGLPAAVAERLSPHGLRHTAITLALEAGVPLEQVQDAAGHRDPRTTQRYNRRRYRLDGAPAYTVADALVTPG